MQTNLEEALEELKLQVRGKHWGKTQLTLNGKTFSLEVQYISKGPLKFRALVDNQNFGEMPTVRGALGCIRRRVQFLSTLTEPSVDQDALTARDMDLELIRRQKIWG